VTALVLNWLDRRLTKSLQQEQALASESITAGFFKDRHRRKVYWGKDRMRRAEGTHMKVLSSVNDSLLKVGTEYYRELDPFHGDITVDIDEWVPTLVIICSVAYLIAAAIPDGVSGAETISIGRLVEAALAIVIWLVMMSLGTGQYEIWGRPYDYVHSQNKTEAYDETVPIWARVEKQLHSDLIVDEPHAQEIVTAELLFEILSATRTTAEVVDDPRIERGDILRLDGQTRLYVEDYTRALDRGSENVLQVVGFRV
jgi:hypothetical protein